MKYYKKQKKFLKLSPVAASLLLLPVMAQAEISIIGGDVTSASNGVPIVNIKEANGSGLSHNVYETLNVGKEGVIFNNASSTAQTVLAGQIAANANLAGGTAKVILNEVTAKNASTINGMMEVAGDSAHLIIANPNGITTQGAGFINAEKGTLTTGTPNLDSAGALTGYSVSGGAITVGGFQSDSPTEILSRSVKVNGEVRVSELSVVAGSNVIDADGIVTGSVAASGAKSTYGVDVSALGGMYAKKISLISTESGVGVRNVGAIAAGDSGINITSNGILVNNSAAIQSSGDVIIGTNGNLNNNAGKINSDGMIVINTAGGAIDNSNSGNISATTNNFINSGTLNNKNGKLAAGQMLAVNTNGNTLTNTGKAKTTGIEAGVVALETGIFDNDNGQLYGGYVGMVNTSLSNNSGVIDAIGGVDVESSGSIDNVAGLIRSSTGTVKLKAAKTVKSNNNKSADLTGTESLGIISGNGIEITADYLFNKSGTIVSSGDIKIETTKDISNYMGKIESSQNISIKGRELQTSQSGINGFKGVDIDLDSFYSRLGIVTANDGDVTIKAQNVSNDSSIILAKNINIQSAANIENKYSMLVADENLTLTAVGAINNSSSDMFGFLTGQYFGYQNQSGGLIGGQGVDITAKSINNTSGRIVAQNGNANINLSGELASTKGQIVANAGSLAISANNINADYATLYSSDNLQVTSNGLSLKGTGSIVKNTATGIISSDKDIMIDINGDYSNNGWVSAKGNVTVNATGHLNNTHTINSESDVILKGKNITNTKDIVARNTLTVSVANDLTNSSGGNITASTTNVNADNISNRGNLVADAVLNITASNNIYNYSNIYTDGKAVINANKIINTGIWAVLGGAQGMQSTANIVNIFGTVVGK